MYKKWIYKDTKNTDENITKLAGDEFLAVLLAQRGLNTEKKIFDFLNPLKMPIISPFAFRDMEKSVARIIEAINNEQQILIWGDFDADGVTSVSVLYKTLTHLGAKVGYYIPEREKENHGLNSKALIKLIAKKKIKLVITVDCGISNFEEVKLLNNFKVDAIITDHHDFDGTIPEAFAILNPKIKDNLNENLDIDEISYMSYLAGVGVAFKLSCALLEKYQENEFIDEILPLVAVGTVADVVPLLGENRCFVTCGLQLISQNRNKGITKLLEIGGYKDTNVTAEKIAFGIAPRINAAGRLSTADIALKVLLSENIAEIDVGVQELDCLNKIRQELCDKIFEEAISQIKHVNEHAIVLFGQGWHIGIIGIVASKIVEKFNKPVFLMTTTEDTPNIVRCSARSIDSVHLYNVIKANEKLFEGFGGHKLAAGLSFDKTKHSFEKIKRAICSEIAKITEDVDLTPKKIIDLEIKPHHLNFDFIEKLEILQPFGECNEFPVFSMKDCILKQFKIIGNNENHSKMLVEKDGYSFDTVYWQYNTQPVETGEKFDIAFYPKINEFHSKKTIQLDIQDLHYEGCETKDRNDENSVKIYDHRKKDNIFRQIDDYLATTAQKIVVFAQEKVTIEKLSKYEYLRAGIKNKTNLEPANQIMFFDYPATEEEMKLILDIVSPEKIHFMQKNYAEIQIEPLLKMVSGMLKYVSNNKNGIIETEYLSGLLGLNLETVNLIFRLFINCGIIKIKTTDETIVHLGFIEPKEFKILKTDRLFATIEEKLKNINDYKKHLLECETSKLEEVLICEFAEV